MERKKHKIVSSEQNVPNLPSDILKLIIEYYPTSQWFTVSKESSQLALQVISPLYYRKTDHCSLCWALKNKIRFAAKSLLTNLHPQLDPSHDDNYAIRWASRNGYTEVVELLLKDPRVDPSDCNNTALRWACIFGHKEVVQLLINRVNPSVNNNCAIREASKYGREELVGLLLQVINECD
jgi:hypothetical protein